MLGGVSTYTNYSALFKNPVGPTNSNPYSNIIYGAGITTLYSKRLNQKLGNEISGYMQSMKSDNGKYKESSAASTEKTARSTAYTKIAGPAVSHKEKNQHSANISNAIESQVNHSSKPNNSKISSSSSGINTYDAKEPVKATYTNPAIKSSSLNNTISGNLNDKLSHAYIDTKEQQEENNGSKVQNEKSQINMNNRITSPAEDNSEIHFEKNNSPYAEQYGENTKYGYGHNGQKVYLSKPIQQGLLFDTIA